MHSKNPLTVSSERIHFDSFQPARPGAAQRAGKIRCNVFYAIILCNQGRREFFVEQGGLKIRAATRTYAYASKRIFKQRSYTENEQVRIALLGDDDLLHRANPLHTRS